jgi:hypothetical protein
MLSVSYSEGLAFVHGTEAGCTLDSVEIYPRQSSCLCWTLADRLCRAIRQNGTWQLKFPDGANMSSAMAALAAHLKIATQPPGLVGSRAWEGRLLKQTKFAESLLILSAAKKQLFPNGNFRPAKVLHLELPLFADVENLFLPQSNNTGISPRSFYVGAVLAYFSRNANVSSVFPTLEKASADCDLARRELPLLVNIRTKH